MGETLKEKDQAQDNFKSEIGIQYLVGLTKLLSMWKFYFPT